MYKKKWISTSKEGLSSDVTPELFILSQLGNSETSMIQYIKSSGWQGEVLPWFHPVEAIGHTVIRKILLLNFINIAYILTDRKIQNQPEVRKCLY